MKENNSKIDIKTKENKKPDIKIFVSHRIDLDAETIDNPLYVNVRCGAVFDKRENVDMLGDDTGDNISEKRESFNELTVMYWAWKNVDADYYGFCDENKYLLLSEKQNKFNNEVLYEEFLTKEIIKKYELDNNKLVDKLLGENDLVIMQPIDIRKVATPKGYAKNIKMYLQNNNHKLLKYEHIEIILDYIRDVYPDIYPYAIKYLNGYQYIQYNNFIMKKNLFNEYCSFQFNILFNFEKKFHKNSQFYSENIMQSLNLIGIVLLGIYYKYLSEKHTKYKQLSVIYFNNTKKYEQIYPFFNTNNIAIVIRISDYYVPYFSVLLQSIISYSNKDNNYDIIVLTGSIKQNNKNILNNMITNKNNFSIRYINPEQYIHGTSLYVSTSSYSREAYYTLFTPYLLKNYDKLLVLDSDLILQGDIAEIFNNDISDCLAAATKEIVFMGMLNLDEQWIEYALEELKIDKPYDYTNTGVILLNTKLIRDKFTFKHIVDVAKNSKFRTQEQDLINILFYGKIKFLDLKYNYYTRINSWNEDMLDNAPVHYKKIYETVGNNPFVIHYANQPKPWSNPNISYADKWWEIARKTPFYEIILYRMTHEQSSHISFSTLDHFSRIMFPFKWLKKVHKIGYIRQIADKLLPHGTKRRKIVKKLIFR